MNHDSLQTRATIVGRCWNPARFYSVAAFTTGQLYSHNVHLPHNNRTRSDKLSDTRILPLMRSVKEHEGVPRMAIKGGCLCGKVSYEITGPLFDASNCHCSMCRRQHGAAFATYADFNPGDFKWVSGEDLVKTYETLPDGGWCFCSECGSSLAGTVKGKITSITLGSVEGDPGIKPESHIFAGSRAQWHEISDALPQFDEWPPDTWEPPSKAP